MDVMSMPCQDLTLLGAEELAEEESLKLLDSILMLGIGTLEACTD